MVLTLRTALALRHVHPTHLLIFLIVLGIFYIFYVIFPNYFCDF